MEETCTDPNEREKLFLNAEARNKWKKSWKGEVMEEAIVEALRQWMN